MTRTHLHRTAIGHALLGLMLAANAPAQDAGLAPEAAAQVDAVFKLWDRETTAGCAVSVTKAGETVYARGFGMAHLEQPAPITPETIFEAGSVSKQFTAAAIVLLALDGKLSLDDPVREHLPELPDFGAPITIRHLLTHTSGLRTFRPLVALRGRPDGFAVHTNAEVLALMARQRELNFPPGEEYLYSNAPYILSVVLAERVSGQSFNEFTTGRIFSPLGMTSTLWRDDFTQIVKRRATAYGTGRSGGLHKNMANTEVFGNGGLLTTVGDLQRWNQELDEPKLLGQQLVDMLETPGQFNDGTESDYALGLAIGEYRGEREIAHSGGTAGYRAWLARYPDRDRLSLALLCNHGDINPVAVGHRAIDVFLGPADKAADAESPRPSVEVPLENLERWADPYLHTRTDSIVRITVRDGALTLGAVRTRPLGEDRFAVGLSGLVIAFETEEDGMRTLTLADDPKRRYVAMPAVTPTPEELAEYVGSYTSDELDVTYSVEFQDGKLLFRRPLEKPRTLEPLFKDAFELSDPLVERFPARALFSTVVAWPARFERDSSGRVTALYISDSSRVRRLRFDRR
ncbi:MAG: serine hydrolase [Holophagales bacterium]|nr:serine hydrolase [Holophagales bacterium]MYD22833.1 serine hydrolase [Holophagales bacterium]MYI32193.1 serine hydrolase [Holophagales bacterium]